MAKYLVIFCLLLQSITHNLSELLTATTNFESLLETETVTIEALENYIRAQEKKIETLKKYVERYQDQHNQAADDILSHTFHPSTAYLFLKRFTVEWQDIKSVIDTNSGQNFITNLSQNPGVYRLPTDEDMIGTLEVLTRLQLTYHLNTSMLAQGKINGIQASSELSAADCYAIGKLFFAQNEFYYTYTWMREAHYKYGKATTDVRKSDILEHMAYSAYKLNNITLALQITTALLELAPDHQKALQNKRVYENSISKGAVSQESYDGKNAKKPLNPHEGEIDMYKRLCRGEVTTSQMVLKDLRCRYMYNGNPFLKIAPFKIEEISLYPKIVVFHDVIYDEEVNVIQQMAYPLFKKAAIRDESRNKLADINVRINKIAFLHDREHKYIADISQRVEDMTGLSTLSAENLQVVNYDAGGHYMPHYDFPVGAEMRQRIGERIATVKFYMNDVEMGGAIAFPYLRIITQPRKGSAIFWYNFDSNGNADMYSKHGSCPILFGSKWVSTKWLHERGQKFRRSCDLVAKK